jgi:hypothetical protein
VGDSDETEGARVVAFDKLFDRAVLVELFLMVEAEVVLDKVEVPELPKTEFS